MDGNRRWAKKQGLLSQQGHAEGVKKAQEVMLFCKQSNIPYLSLYLFSLENFNRSDEEKNFLFYNILTLKAHEFIDYCQKHSIKIRFIGERSSFPQNIIQICTSIEEETKTGCDLTVDLLFCYGGQQEILSATQTIVQKIMQGYLDHNTITIETIKSHLWTHPTPPPDLVIRTGGMHRLSNFLLFQSAYSEIIILDQLWPELTLDLLEQTLNQFYKTKRNFGV